MTCVRGIGIRKQLFERVQGWVCHETLQCFSMHFPSTLIVVINLTIEYARLEHCTSAAPRISGEPLDEPSSSVMPFLPFLAAGVASRMDTCTMKFGSSTRVSSAKVPQKLMVNCTDADQDDNTASARCK